MSDIALDDLILIKRGPLAGKKGRVIICTEDSVIAEVHNPDSFLAKTCEEKNLDPEECAGVLFKLKPEYFENGLVEIINLRKA